MIPVAPRLSFCGPTPTKRSEFGSAWRIDLEAWRKAHGAAGAEICGWIIEAPWAHPMWHSYILSAVHLREVPGWPPPKIGLAGATHEVMLLALDPSYTPSLVAFPHYLSPGNFFGQWIAESDDAARLKIEACVDEVLAGKLSPDTDFRREWIARFSDSNIKPEWKGREGDTYVGIAKDGALVVVGTGKIATEIIAGAAAAAEKPPEKKDLH